MTHERSEHRAQRIVVVTAIVLGVPEARVRRPRNKRDAYARRVAAYALWVDCGSDESVGRALEATRPVAAGWRAWVQRSLLHDRTVQRDLGRLATALRTWAAGRGPAAGTLSGASARPQGGTRQTAAGG